MPLPIRLLLLAVLALMLVPAPPVAAQSCVSDSECTRSLGFGSNARCVGEYYEITGSRCDALLGACTTRAERIPCRQGCVCRDNVLTVSTGACSPAIGCHRAVRRCPGGCACKPEPVCKEK